MDSHAYDDNIIIPTLNAQMGLDLPEFNLNVQADQGIYFNAEVIDLEYDLYLIMMSAGKDSLACLLHLLEQGVPPERIELWHHLVDGNEGSSLMDWPCIHDYNQKISEHFNIPIYYSWLKHGFEGEMLKNNSVSHPDMVETPDGLITLERDMKRAKPNTRLKFPQVSNDLSTRWCSGLLKIAVARRALNNQSRLNNKKICFITGERREESSNRARYNQFEPHACDRRNGKLKRHIDTWRPVLEWSEERVWDILQRHRIIAPVPYRLNWSRSSCLSCIFNGPRIWATIREHFPEHLRPIAEYEKQFGTTINRERIPIMDVAARAKPFIIEDTEALAQAMRKEYTLPGRKTNTLSLSPSRHSPRLSCRGTASGVLLSLHSVQK